MKRKILFTALVVIFGLQVIVAQDKAVTPSVVKTDLYHTVVKVKDLPVLTGEELDIFQKEKAKFKKNRSFEEKMVDYPNRANALPRGEDPVRQSQMGESKVMSYKGVTQDFDGQTMTSGWPPDPNGTAGPDHYMQTINSTYAIYEKATGNRVAGPTALNSFFSGLPGGTYNDGDPIVMYDEQAQRFLMAEFSISGSNDYMLIAVSQTSDPTGNWNAYSFDVADMPDYEKFGIWQDGYYMGTNNQTGDDIYVFERAQMLTGGSAQMVAFDNPWRRSGGIHTVPPLDNDGAFAPSGTPGLFITINDDAWTSGSSDQLWIFELDVDWSNTSSATFNRVQQIDVASFNSEFNASWNDLTQQGTSQKIMANPFVIMNAPQYRNFGSYQTIMCCHTVDIGSDQAGIRWYELRNTGSTWSIRQQGTYAPDSHSRFMGSIRLNGSNEIGLGYSITSSSLYPGIRYTGQSASAYAAGTGTLDVTEETILTGTTYQSSSNRWGDYSSLSVDPNDDRTFWYTTEYIGSSGYRNTRIAAFSVTTEPVSPVANFSASPTSTFTNSTIALTDASTGVPTSWTWSFSGPGSVTYVDGTSASSQNPKVQFATAGTYSVTLNVSNSIGSDGETKSNYLTVTESVPVTLPWTEDFENESGSTYTATTASITGLPEWNYEKTASGRLRFAAGSGFYHGGTKAATMDANPSGTNSVNYLVTTLDLSNYSSSSSLTLSFFFMHHGEESSTNDRVWVRGSSADSWVEIYNLYSNQGTSGSWNEVVDLDIDAALSGASQSITSTFQIRFGQEDNYPATSTTASDGYTFDDIVINSATGSAPVANFIASPTSANINTTISLTDQSTETPTSWSWSFSGPGSVSYIGGTSATSQNPQVQFATAGTYSVTLQATNTYGSDTETKLSYLTITDPGGGITLPWTEDFEAQSGTTYTSNQTSIAGLTGWSYEKTNNGRLRFAAGSGFYHGGTKAATIDCSTNGTYSENYLIVTLDISGYASSTNLQLSFYYMHHGEETHVTDRVWIRGSSADSWIEVYDLFANKASAGSWKTVTGIDVDAALAGASQSITSTFQIRFGEQDNYQASSTTQSDGFTFDDISLTENTAITYCTAGATTCDEYISRVQLGSIDNATTCTSGGYHDYTSISTSMNIGSSYNLSVTNGNTSYPTDQCGIWVDWNQNGDFTDDNAISVTGTPGVGPYSATITPPTGATTGNTRMRIRIMYTGTVSSCGNATYGEVEDYTVNVAPAMQMVTADKEQEIELESHLFIYSNENKIFIQNLYEEAVEGQAFIYDISGKIILNKQLEKSNLNIIEINGESAYYIVKVIGTNKVYSSLVFIK